MRLPTAHKLAPFVGGRDNNFNLIRLGAAVGVLVSHTVLITDGREAVPRGMWVLGSVSVWAFFMISGFLIAASFERRASVAGFTAARCLRIFPALIVCVVLTAVVLGPSQTTLNLSDYFTDPQTYRFIIGNISLFWETRELPGVFTTHPVDHAQITLWTLKHEFLCYIGLAVLGMAGIFTSTRAFAWFLGLALLSWMAVRLIETYDPDALPQFFESFRKVATMFVLGVAAYRFRERIFLSWIAVAVLVVATWVFWWTPLLHVLLPVTVAYSVLWAAFLPNGRVRRFNELGDYSYGVYIFGIPVQQVLVSALGPHSAAVNGSLGIILTMGLAVISWHAIEKPSLSLKERFSAPPRSADPCVKSS